jgi:hypothetical protein
MIRLKRAYEPAGPSCVGIQRHGSHSSPRADAGG